MVDNLKQLIRLPKIDRIRIATGYWDLPGLMLVADDLRYFFEQNPGNKLQIIIGKDAYVYANMMKNPKYKDASYPADYIRIDLDSLADGIKDEHLSALKLLIEYCDESKNQMEVKIFKTNEDDERQFFHSKCYIFTEGKDEQGIGIIGSSNFTLKGLEGNSELNYLETNSMVVCYDNQGGSRKGHVKWFEEKWNQADDWTKEFLEQVIKKSEPAKKITKKKEDTPKPIVQTPLTPYELYIKLLQYKFGDMLDVDTTQVISSYLPNGFSPLEYQMDAVKQCFSIMQAHGGFMLADVVGLGKTVVGTLIIKHFLNFPDDGRERKVLVITPPAIKKAWTDTIKDFDKDSNDQIAPLVDFVTTGSIGNLIDDEGEPDNDENTIDSGDFETALDYKNYGLIIIDESHKFRNSNTNMYIALDNLISQIGGNTGVYPYIGLLSATPQNNTPNDLKNQIYLFERNHQYCTLEKVDGRNLESFFADIMQSFLSLRKEASDISKTKASQRTADQQQRLVEINDEFKVISATIRDTILCDVLVRRTRTDIKKFYEADMNAQNLVFPKISGPHCLEYKMYPKLASLFADTMDKIVSDDDYSVDGKNFLYYYRYRAIEYIKDDLVDSNKESIKNKRYSGKGAISAEKLSQQLAKIMQMLLVKRLESSFPAFKKSLLNLRNYTNNMIKMWENNTIFICPQIDVNKELDYKAKDEKRRKKNSQSPKYTFAECVEDIRNKIKKLTEEDRNKRGQNAEYTRDDFDPVYIDLLKADYELIGQLYDEWAEVNEDPKMNAFKDNLKSVLFDEERNRPQKLVIFTEAIDTVNALCEACESKGYSVLAITAANRDEKQQIIQENFDANYKGEWKNDYQIIITTEVLAEGINLHRANCILNYDTPWNSTRLMQRIGRVNRIGSTEPFVYVYNFMPSAQGDQQIQLVEKAHIKLQSFHTLFGEDSKIFTEEETVEHFDLNDVVNGEESPYEQYIYQLKKYRENNPERYEFICNKEDDLQFAISTSTDGNSYFVVRTPKMKGLFVKVDSSGKGKIITGIDMYPSFVSPEDEQRAQLPDDWERRCNVAIRAVGQHLAKMNSYKVKDKSATNAKAIIIKMSENSNLKDSSLNLLQSAFQMVNKGNSDIIRIINAIGKEVFDQQLTLFVMSQDEIDSLIERKLNNIVAEQAQTIGKPEVYIGLAK